MEVFILIHTLPNFSSTTNYLLLCISFDKCSIVNKDDCLSVHQGAEQKPVNQLDRHLGRQIVNQPIRQTVS